MTNRLQVPACFEILHEQITGESTVIVVHCRSNRDRRVKVINASFPRLARVRKCCPHAAIFDRRTRACVPALNGSRNVLAFLPNGLVDVDLVVIATKGPPRCRSPIVDYEVDADDVFLRNDTYSVSEKKRREESHDCVLRSRIREQLLRECFERPILINVSLINLKAYKRINERLRH